VADIREPKHQRALVDEFDIRGQGFVSPELEPSIQPVVLVSDVSTGRPPDPQSVVARCSWGRDYTSAASGNPAVQLQPAIGVVAVVRRLILAIPAGGVPGFFLWGFAGTAIGTGLEFGLYWDGRRAGQPSTTVARNTGLSVFTPLQPNIGAAQIDAGRQIIIPDLEIALKQDGTGPYFEVAYNQVAAEASITIEWTEQRS
jgi:hypothetical protein